MRCCCASAALPARQSPPNPQPSPVWRTLSEASYGIYWLHQMILMPAVYLLIPWNLPIGIKFILALGGTYILCAFLTIHGLKKLPVLRRLF